MKKIYTGQEARTKLLKGVKTLADLVTTTLGPKGRNIGLDRKYTPPIVVHDGVSVAREVVLEDACENFGAQIVKQAASKTNDMAGDGCQDLDSKILTPTGWIRMGDVRVGMDICGTNGTTQKVIGIYKKGDKEMFNVSFHGGAVVRCSNDHDWTVTTHNGLEKTMKLSKIMDDFEHKYYVKKTVVDFIEQKEGMPIDPYLLGVLLGDGSLSDDHRSTIEISLGKKKEHILNKLILPKGIEMRSTWVEDKNYFRVKLTGKDEGGRSMREIINSLGLLGHTSHTKFIPDQYLFSSIKSRKALLQGLIDTDGYIKPNKTFEYYTVSEKLKSDFIALCSSLGKHTTVLLKKRKEGKSYSMNSIYRIYERKGHKYGEEITNIQSTGELVEMQCIKVTNPDNLYITDDYITTHNTTTSTLLAYKMVEKGFDEVAKGANPMIIKNGMVQAGKDIVEELKKMSTNIKTEDQIKQIATLSAGNPELGGVIATAMSKVGKDGIVTVEEGDRMDTYVDYKEGMELDVGYISPYFTTDNSKMVADIETPHIAICDHTIRAGQEVAEFLKRFVNETKRVEIVIICPKIEADALHTLLLNNQQSGLLSLAVYAPGFGRKQLDLLDDIATLTGATIIAKSKNMSIGDTTIDMLGKADRVIASEKSTRIIGGKGTKTKIKSRVDEIRALIEKEDSDFEKMKLKERIATLTTGAAIIKTGAQTEVELKENKERVIDAVEAVKASREMGINIGGGVSLYQIADSLKNNLAKFEGDVMVGYKIVIDSLREPLKKLLENAGEDLKIIDQLKLEWVKDGLIGYDLVTQKYGNLYKMGIIEPVLVQKQAIINSISVSSIILTTEGVMVYNPSELEKELKTN